MTGRGRRTVAGMAVAALAAAWLLAAGIAAAADRTVEMTDNAFGPGTVTIRAGDRVTWTNDGQAPHNAVGDDWGTETITSGNSDSVRFRKAGTYDYVCTFHAEMTGTVVVRAASGGGGGGGGGGGNPGPAPTQPPTDALATAQVGTTAIPGELLAVLAASGLAGLLLGARRPGREERRP